MRRPPAAGAVRAGALLATLVTAATSTLAAQAIGRAAVDSLHYPPLHFSPPLPEVHEVRGVKVLYLEDPTLPLVDVMARFKGGYARFPRRLYAAGTALPSLLRFGGTTELSPDSVDEALEYYAIQTTFGGDGHSVWSSLNTLTENLPVAIDLWGRMLRSPGFDSAEVEGWRGRELESVRRRPDDPGSFAVTEFNRLLYGDHPIGWEMEPSDLTPDRLSRAALLELDRSIVCPGNLVLGVSGDVAWSEVETLLARLLDGWPPCSAPLPPSPVPHIRRTPGVFLIPRKIEQSVIVMAHPTSVRMGADREYFAARVGNQILGGGGFESRLMSRVRTEKGYAYSVASVWTMPRRFDGILGAITRTRPSTTVHATRLILQVMKGLVDDRPPEPEEVRTVVDEFENGFAFNFQYPAEIVSRRMFYMSDGFPEDWLERYLDGLRHVTAASVGDVLAKNLRPQDMTILVVGDSARIGLDSLKELGPVTIWNPEDGPPPRPVDVREAPGTCVPQPLATPQWMAAIPPVRSCQPASSYPASRNSRRSSSGPGNSRTDSGR